MRGVPRGRVHRSARGQPTHPQRDDIARQRGASCGKAQEGRVHVDLDRLAGRELDHVDPQTHATDIMSGPLPRDHTSRHVPLDRSGVRRVREGEPKRFLVMRRCGSRARTATHAESEPAREACDPHENAEAGHHARDRREQGHEVDARRLACSRSGGERKRQPGDESERHHEHDGPDHRHRASGRAGHVRTQNDGRRESPRSADAAAHRGIVIRRASLPRIDLSRRKFCGLRSTRGSGGAGSVRTRSRRRTRRRRDSSRARSPCRSARGPAPG